MLHLAYIDPGAGSLLIQALIAGALTVPFLFRANVAAAWRRLRSVWPPNRNLRGR